MTFFDLLTKYFDDAIHDDWVDDSVIDELFDAVKARLRMSVRLPRREGESLEQAEFDLECTILDRMFALLTAEVIPSDKVLIGYFDYRYEPRFKVALFEKDAVLHYKPVKAWEMIDYLQEVESRFPLASYGEKKLDRLLRHKDKLPRPCCWCSGTYMDVLGASFFPSKCCTDLLLEAAVSNVVIAEDMGREIDRFDDSAHSLNQKRSLLWTLYGLSLAIWAAKTELEKEEKN